MLVQITKLHLVLKLRKKKAHTEAFWPIYWKKHRTGTNSSQLPFASKQAQRCYHMPTTQTLNAPSQPLILRPKPGIPQPGWFWGLNHQNLVARPTKRDSPLFYGQTRQTICMSRVSDLPPSVTMPSSSFALPPQPPAYLNFPSPSFLTWPTLYSSPSTLARSCTKQAAYEFTRYLSGPSAQAYSRSSWTFRLTFSSHRRPPHRTLHLHFVAKRYIRHDSCQSLIIRGWAPLVLSLLLDEWIDNTLTSSS